MAKQLKVLLVANVAKEHVLKFHVPTLKLLKQNGWFVDVACAGKEKVPFCDNQFCLSYKRSPFNASLVNGIYELQNIIQDGHYDVIYCHTPVGGFAARIAARKARKSGTKVVYMAHGFHFFKGAPIINWLVYYPIEKILSFLTDAIILINKEDYELTQKKFTHCKSYLIDGIGIDFSRFDMLDPEGVRHAYREQLNIPQDAHVLVYLAELIPNKNQMFLLNVLKKVLNTCSNVYLLLAGFDHSNGAVMRHAQDIGVTEHVRYLGWREDVCNLYMTADICTATSIREGFGLNLVEAMYCRCPVIASQNRGHETVIQDQVNGYLVAQNDEDTFKDRILTLIDHQEIYHRLVENATRRIEKYSSQTSAARVMEILEETRNGNRLNDR